MAGAYKREQKNTTDGVDDINSSHRVIRNKHPGYAQLIYKALKFGNIR